HLRNHPTSTLSGRRGQTAATTVARYSPRRRPARSPRRRAAAVQRKRRGFRPIARGAARTTTRPRGGFSGHGALVTPGLLLRALPILPGLAACVPSVPVHSA